MGFQIKTKEGKALPINTIDEQVANIWGLEVDSHAYVSPGPNHQNWYDSIGYTIHSGMKWTSGWNGVKCALMSLFTDDLALKSEEEQIESIKHTNQYLKPYFMVIDEFIKLEYEPVQVKD